MPRQATFAWLHPGTLKRRRRFLPPATGQTFLEAALAPFALSTQTPHGFLGRDLACSRSLERSKPHGLPLGRASIRPVCYWFGARLAPDGRHYLVQPRPSGVVRDAQVGCQPLQIVTSLQQKANKIQLIGRQSPDPAETELTFDGHATAGAPQTRND